MREEGGPPPPGAPEEDPPGAPEEDPPPRTRRRENRIDWGTSFLTVRESGGAITGYQMTCSNPSHKHVGEKSCTREMRLGVVQDRPPDEQASCVRRALKAWVLLGAACENRQQHMAPEWRTTVMDLILSDNLLPEWELDAMAPTEWASDVDTPVLGLGVPPPDAAIGLGHRGEAPADLHEEMQRLAEQGLVPVTTLAQRRRCRKAGSSTYSGPPDLSRACEYGYLHPNLPPPLGMIWRCSGGHWRLVPRGG